MTFLYVLVAYIIGFLSPLTVLAIYRRVQVIEEKLKERPEEGSVQFVDPEPLRDRLKDGTQIKDILQ